MPVLAISYMVHPLDSLEVHALSVYNVKLADKERNTMLQILQVLVLNMSLPLRTIGPIILTGLVSPEV